MEVHSTAMQPFDEGASMSTASIRKNPAPKYVSTRNACKLCTPLGATLAFRGIEGALPFLHGSQGCATYMRRYIISHFREPMDIAASGFSEASTIFGGGENLRQGLRNVTSQYHPSLIGIATTCLTETIGEDVSLALHEYENQPHGEDSPLLVNVATPSYCGTHVDGFHDAVRSIVSSLAAPTESIQDLNILPGLCSAADLRYLKEIVRDFGSLASVLPDYSDTLDGPALVKYEKIPAGGTPLAQVRASGSAKASIEFGRTLQGRETAAAFLEERFGVTSYRIGSPIGLRESDAFFEALEKVSCQSTPANHREERGRLIDSFVDAHKYVFGKRAVVYGEEDLVTGIVSLLTEIGIIPVLCASGGQSGKLAAAIREIAPEIDAPRVIQEDTDFQTIAEQARDLQSDLVIGNSKGQRMARELGVPLVRIGFPIHDRFGGQRILHFGYRGAQQLFDRIVNALIEHKQEASPVGYSYM